jgi:hypothetical protein
VAISLSSIEASLDYDQALNSSSAHYVGSTLAFVGMFKKFL